MEKTKCISLWCIVTFLVLFFISPRYVYAQNATNELRIYGSFEIAGEMSEETIRSVWKKWSAETKFVKDDPKEGAYCALIEGGGIYLQLRSNVIAPGDRLFISCYVRSEPFAGPGYRNCLAIWAYAEDEPDPYTNRSVTAVSKNITFPASGKWKEMKELYDVPAGIASLYIRFHRYNHPGKTWIDDVKISVIKGGVAASANSKDESAVPLTASKFNYLPAHSEIHPQITNWLSTNMLRYAAEVADILALSEEELIAVLPKKAGIYFVGCANCALQGQGSDFDWSLKEPEKIRCRKCGQAYPSDKYPADKEIIVAAPSGKKITYSYHQNKMGVRYYFEAGAEFRKKMYFEHMVWLLGTLYALTKEERYAEKAAIILLNFAKYYPDFVYKFDFPNTPIEFYDGLNDPRIKQKQYRASRWDWWAYMDVPYFPVLAYDRIYHSPSLERYLKLYHMDRWNDLEEGFFHRATEGVFWNTETYHNMSPTFWKSAIAVGRITGAPDYVHLVIDRFRHYVNSQFYFDGFWNEPSVSYFHQSSQNAFNDIFRIVQGFRDPPGFRSLYNSNVYTNFIPDNDFGGNVGTILQTLEQSYYPDGRGVPMGDTWMFPPSKYPGMERHSYFQAAVGHAALCSETNGNQVQLHVTWTPKTGHWHADNLGISVWANKREIISDIGYTHTKYKPWTVATASHNTVVIDYKNQAKGKDMGRGDIIYLDNDPLVQIVAADGRRMYNDRPYQRTSFLIKKGDDRYYIADFFKAGGGETYDYFIHGNADSEDDLALFDDAGNAVALSDANAVDPEKLGAWEPPGSEQESPEVRDFYAYGFLRGTKAASSAKGAFVRSVFTASDKSGFSLFSAMIDGEHTSFFCGRNPSVRQAGSTDNSLLEKYFRKFVMMRKEKKGAVRFQSVIEPFADEGRVSKIKAVAENILLVGYGDDTDIVFIEQKTPVSVQVNGITVELDGEYGFVSMAGRNVKHYRIVNGGFRAGAFAARSAKGYAGIVAAVPDERTLRLGAKLPYTANEQLHLSQFIKVEHGNGQTHGYFLDRIDDDGATVRTTSQLGFRIVDEKQKISKMYVFPNTVMEGDNRVHIFSIAAGTGK